MSIAGSPSAASAGVAAITKNMAAARTTRHFRRMQIPPVRVQWTQAN